ncbi:hypothetical protein ACWD4L_45275 [Streptomyces sp. NPDC002596]
MSVTVLGRFGRGRHGRLAESDNKGKRHLLRLEESAVPGVMRRWWKAAMISSVPDLLAADRRSRRRRRGSVVLGFVIKATYERQGIGAN